MKNLIYFAAGVAVVCIGSAITSRLIRKQKPSLYYDNDFADQYCIYLFIPSHSPLLLLFSAKWLYFGV